MLLKAYSFYDRKVGTYSVPMFFPHEAYLHRAVSSLVNDVNTTVGQHPGDYDVHELGTFDDQMGTFTHDGARFVTNCLSLVAQRADTPLFDEAAQ